MDLPDGVPDRGVKHEVDEGDDARCSAEMGLDDTQTERMLIPSGFRKSSTGLADQLRIWSIKIWNGREVCTGPPGMLQCVVGFVGYTRRSAVERGRRWLLWVQRVVVKM
jgi:hypothetical protein